MDGPTDISPGLLRTLSDRMLDPLFWTPALLDPDSAWCGHIPFAHWIVGAMAPRVLVELGTHTGVSYMAFCLAVEREALDTRCFAVDTWRGDEHAGYYDDGVLARLRDKHDPRFGTFSSLLRCTFDEALSQFADDSLDLLHIDGLHTFEAVSHDFEAWLPKLTDRAVVLFHDTNERDGDFGVWRLWADLRRRYPSFEFLHGHGLGVLGVGTSVAPALAALFECADPAVLATTKRRFALLGDRWAVEQARINEAGHAARNHAAQLASVQAEAAAADAQAQAGRSAVEARAASAIADAETARIQAEASLAAAIADADLSRASADARAAEAIAAAEAARQDRRQAIETAAAERVRDHASMSLLHQDLDRIQGAAEAAMQAAARQHNAAEAAAREALHDRVQEVGRRAAMEASTSWRLTAPLRRVLGRRGRKAVLDRAGRVSGSSLFDPDWYLRRYPDAKASGMPPALHFVLCHVSEKRDPGPHFNTRAYLARYPDAAGYGDHALLHYLDHGIAEGRTHLAEALAPRRPAPVVLPSRVGALPSPPSAPPVALSALLAARFHTMAPLRVFGTRDTGRRVSMVTDSVAPGSLFGGVATAIVLSSLLARHLGASLRIITLRQPPDPATIASVLATHRIETSGPIEFLHAGPDRAEEVPVNYGELFLTTSWWSTRSVRPVLYPAQIIYLLQEDERMFYPHGDDHLRCVETLSDPAVRYVVNSHLLFRHLTEGPAALDSIAARGSWFEPAFPAFEKGAREPSEGGKRHFFFYARPDYPRNLYWLGLETIGEAIEENLLDPDLWEFHFVGRDLTPVAMPRGVRPHISQNLPWPEYAKLIRRMDMGLCLMDTPHSSYPPLDIAASGGIAVTNRYGIKQSLAHYSSNILCIDPTVTALKDGIAQAVARLDGAGDPRGLLAGDNINRDWSSALAPLMAELCS